jgi:hypothetical protein
MAEIVQAPPPESVGGVGSIFNVFVSYWWVFLIIALFIGLILLIYFLWMKNEEADKRRDSSVYATAVNLAESSKINARKEWIRKRYSLWNLLWFGIPFKYIEHSLQVRDARNQLLGYYRGHTMTQSGDHVFRLYKKKIFLGLMEDIFLLYCPTWVQVPRKDKEGNVIIGKSGVTQYEVKPLPKSIIEFDMKGKEITIRCNTIQKMGDYYFFPNYVLITPDGEHHLDLTKTIQEDIAKQNFIVTVERAYSDMSRAVGRASELNPWLRYSQKEPEKEKEISEDDYSQATRH